MKPNHAEICRLGILEQIFNKFHLFNFSEIFIILLRYINNSNSAKKSVKYFLRQKLKKKKKKSLYYRNCIGQTSFWP